MISVVVINSRGSLHPDWVQTCLDSIERQSLDNVELIVIDNLDRGKTIGKCWNEGVRKSKNDYVFFLGDDDWVSRDLLFVLLQYALENSNFVNWTTFMTTFDEDTKLYAPLQRQHTGMWKKEYLLKYPFNENLLKGIDREYVEEVKKNFILLNVKGLTVNEAKEIISQNK